MYTSSMSIRLLPHILSEVGTVTSMDVRPFCCLIKPGACQQHMPGFVKLFLCRHRYVCVFSPEAINN